MEYLTPEKSRNYSSSEEEVVTRSRSASPSVRRTAGTTLTQRPLNRDYDYDFIGTEEESSGSPVIVRRPARYSATVVPRPRMPNYDTEENFNKGAPVGSARGDNFFSRLPAEVLEHEILPWLSPPGVAALLLAANLAVSSNALPIVYIWWKRLEVSYPRKTLTLTVGSRNDYDQRVLEDITPRVMPANPGDYAYLQISDGDAFIKTYCAEDVAICIMMNRTENISPVAVPNLILGSLMTHTLPEYFEAYGAAELLKLGGDHFKNTPEVPFIEYVLREAEEYARYMEAGVRMLHTVNRKTVHRLINELYSKKRVRSCEAIDILLREQICVWSNAWKWSTLPTGVYRHALSSGYIWFLLTSDCEHTLFGDLDDAKWSAFVADTLPRVVQSSTRVNISHFEKTRGMSFGRRLADIIELCGTEQTIECLARRINDSSIFKTIVFEATKCREILGDAYFAMIAKGHPYLYITSGAPYAENLGIPLTFHIAERCIKYDNPVFLRGMLPGCEDFGKRGYNLYKECFKLSRVECLVIIMEHGVTIPPRGLYKLLSECTSRNILNLFI